MVRADVTALVPLKSLSSAKTRLAGALDAHERRTLACWMATRVLAACREADAVGRVVLLADDAPTARAVDTAGVEVAVMSQSGLGPTLAEADARFGHEPATLVLAADLPLVCAADVDAVCTVGWPAPAVVIAPADDGGTAALLRRPPSAMGSAFGPGSARAHERLARAAGLAPRLVRRAGMAHDVDEPADLEALERAPADSPAGPLPIRLPGHGRADQATTGERTMPQGTVKHFDAETFTGTVILDDETEVAVDADTFTASGLEELRFGQRVRLEVDEAAEGMPRAATISLVSL